MDEKEFCIYCGNRVGRDWHFCPKCGNKIIRDEVVEKKEISEDILIEAKKLRTLGHNYKNGIDVHSNSKKAFEYFMESAKLGYAPAYVDLGIMYGEGLGVEKNYQKAFEWFKKAADVNDKYGERNVALYYKEGLGIEKNPEKNRCQNRIGFLLSGIDIQFGKLLVKFAGSDTFVIFKEF